MHDLTLCMPSNRSFAASRASIESCIAFSEDTGCRLVISDNSGDAQKRQAYEGRVPGLTYLVPENDNPMVNLLTALSAVETPFLMPAADDDLIRLDRSLPRLDLSTLGADVAVVRPQTEIWAQDSVARTETFTVEGATAGERMMDYSRKALGSNCIYYSLFRSDVFLPLIRRFAAAHPTRGGYCDWAIVFVILACGAARHDPAIVYRYDLGRWSTRGTMQGAKKGLFEEAGLPAAAEDYSALLSFLDIYTLLFTRELPLSPEDRETALAAASRLTLGTFLASVRARPQAYDEVTCYLAELMSEETALNGVFAIALLIADCLQPGLRERYVAFFHAVSAG